jgi:hypothetical protein
MKRKGNPMIRKTLMVTTVVGALALLAACGSKEPPAAAAPEADAAAQPEAPPPAAGTPPPELPATQPPTTATKPAAPKPAAPKPAAKPVQVVVVPAGTVLPLSLSTALSSKTAKVGDRITAVLATDVVVDGKTAIASGTTVAGEVAVVESGSDGIGGKPTLVLSFDRLELAGGKDIPIAGQITEKGKSDTVGDTAKIVGGTAVGAVIGDKVIKGKKGKVIGGILGGATGAVVAQKTGTEARLKEGESLTLTLDAPVEITK